MSIKSDGEIAVMNKYLANLLDCQTTDVYEKLEELLNQLLPKKSLHEYGVKPEEIDEAYLLMQKYRQTYEKEIRSGERKEKDLDDLFIYIWE